MANYIAIKIDRKEIAEMSCIVGVGGNVKSLVKTAKAGRKIIAIDGCPLACSKACLSNHGIQANLHVELTQYGVKKMKHVDFDQKQAEEMLQMVEDKIRENILSPSSKTTAWVYEEV